MSWKASHNTWNLKADGLQQENRNLRLQSETIVNVPDCWGHSSGRGGGGGVLLCHSDPYRCNSKFGGSVLPGIFKLQHLLLHLPKYLTVAANSGQSCTVARSDRLNHFRHWAVCLFANKSSSVLAAFQMTSLQVCQCLWQECFSPGQTGWQYLPAN